MLLSSKSVLDLQKFLSPLTRCMGTQNFKWKPSKRKPNKKPKLPIILTEDFEKLGRKWQIVPVERGYARNYLIPQGIAAYATPENLKKYNIDLDARGDNTGASAGASPKTVSFIANANLEILMPENTEFEITEYYISHGCKTRLGLHVPVHTITLPGKITQFGEYFVDITINGCVTVPLKTTVGKLRNIVEIPDETGAENIQEGFAVDYDFDDEFLDPEMPEI